ncbi:CBN-PFD-5 protein [Caenorhabditis brenneri]|uniref:Probable prefoldin subunit 5 n=1 Tax=Caenorhabditis brenneri TaxID=135651 RepID=G0N5K7_CAEBE|nr:CBN-PFD-5 protein [Caenorhabditis brenneri]
MAEEPKGVPLSELSLQQLGELQKNCEQELTFFQESFQALKGLMTRNEKSISALEDVKVATAGHTALIPLSESLYIRAELSDPSKHMVEIGTGYFVELDREKAKAIFDRKKAHITKQVETVEGILKEKRRTRAYISDAFQTKVQAQLATMGTQQS